MSRGLGKVERAILEYLRLEKDCGGCSQAENCTVPDQKKTWNRPNWYTGATISALRLGVEGLAICPHQEDWLKHLGEYSYARYQSVCRAVRTLRRKGLVEVEPVTSSFNSDDYGIEFHMVSLCMPNVYKLRWL